MKMPQKSPGFVAEVLLGLVLSLAGAAAFAALSFVMPAVAALRLVICLLALIYAALVIARSSERSGRIVALLAWPALVVAVWLLPVSLPALAALCVGALWLTRALFCRDRFASALLDLGLGFLSLGFAAWAALRSGGVFLPLWCFFLIQALHTAVPAFASKITRSKSHPDWQRSGARQGSSGGAAADAPDARFEQAFQAADEALQRLATRL